MHSLVRTAPHGPGAHLSVGQGPTDVVSRGHPEFPVEPGFDEDWGSGGVDLFIDPLGTNPGTLTRDPRFLVYSTPTDS